MANNDLLQRTLAHIEAHPEEWDQEKWAQRTDCGTAYCFAGTAVHLADPQLTPYFEGFDVTGFMQQPNGTKLHIPGLARKLLGLAEDEGHVLFDQENELGDLRRMVGNLIAGRYVDES